MPLIECIQILWVDLWSISCDIAAWGIGSYQSLLSAEEQVRAAGYVFERDRGRFVVGRCALRGILAQYLGVPPGCVVLESNAYGKPVLSRRFFPGSDLQFNLSHAGDFALLAVTREREIGVDIEHCRTLPDLAGLMDIIGAEAEKRCWTSMPAERREAAFWRLWTAKEALLKGEGCGFSGRPSEVDISPLLEKETACMTHAGKPWFLQRIGPAPGYIATVAVQTDVMPVIGACRVFVPGLLTEGSAGIQ